MGACQNSEPVLGFSWIEALVSNWNCIFWRVIILTNSSNEVKDEGVAGDGVAAGLVELAQLVV